MKVIVVYDGDLQTLPPLRSLLKVLKDLDVGVAYVGSDRGHTKDAIEEISIPNRIVHFKNYSASLLRQPIKRIINTILRSRHYEEYRTAFWNAIDALAEGDSDVVIWSAYMNTAALLGDRALRYGRRHIHTFYELGDEYGKDVPGFNLEKMLASSTIVQCERNRAEIFAALNNLERVPFVIPNCPCEHPRNLNLPISNQVAAELIDKIKGKFLFLYQGVMQTDRSGIVDVLEWLCESFPEDIVAIMSWQNVLDFSRLNKYANFVHIPFVPAPRHLEVTSHASVGIAFYQRANNGYSPLNAVYCAPNKIYEYSGFGIPILSNNMPGLYYTVGTSNAGRCFEEFTKESVVSAAREIKLNYDKYKEGAKTLFENVDLKGRVKDILNYANTETMNNAR